MERGGKIGGPAIAGGPLSEPWYGDYNGDTYVHSLMQHCVQENVPLDFISWHEYAWPSEQYRREAGIIKNWLRDEFPELGTPELFITEWNYSWGFTQGQDTRVGATWACNTLVRGMLAGGVDVPCFFLFQDHNSDQRFRGYWGLLTHDGIPKAQYNVYKMISMLGDNVLDNDNDPSRDHYYDIGVLPTAFSDSSDLAVLCWYNWVGGEDRQFCVRWSGTISFPESATYEFRVEMDDGFRFKIGQQVLHSELKQGWYPKTFAMYSNAEEQDFLLEYHEVLGNAKARLWWKRPGAEEEILSGSFLSHGEETGLLGEYYTGPDFDRFEFSRCDNDIDFDWGQGGTPFSGSLGFEQPYDLTFEIHNPPYRKADYERYEVSSSYANPAEIDIEHAELEVVEQVSDVTTGYRPHIRIENHNVMLLRFTTTEPNPTEDQTNFWRSF